MDNLETFNKREYVEPQCKCEKPKTIADKIRSNNDMYMSVQIAGCIVSYLIQNEIVEGTEADHKELISGIADDVLEWLQSEVKEGADDECN